MKFKEFSAKTVNEAIIAAAESFGVPSDKLEVNVIEEGSAGFLGIGSKAAKISAAVKEDKEESACCSKAEESVEKCETKAEVKSAPANVDADSVIAEAKKFLEDVFASMKYEVNIDVKYEASENVLDIDLSGDDMGVLIGKRGQTLDSLQYLVSLVVNKGTSDYVRVKVDTENYRERRKETLENLAKNIAYKVKRTKRSVSLEPMNPYERRIIHSALQNDKYVTTHSEGEEPFRRVVVTLKRNH